MDDKTARDFEDRITVLEQNYAELDKDLTDLVRKINSNMSVNRLISIGSTAVIIILFLYMMFVFLPGIRH